MSGQFTSRDLLAFSMYEEVQVSKYLNTFYEYLFLSEYDSLFPELGAHGNKSTNKNVERYEKEFKKVSEEPEYKFKHKYKLFNKISDHSFNNQTYSEASHDSYNTVIPVDGKPTLDEEKAVRKVRNLGHGIMYLLFNKYKKYNIITHLNDPTKLVVIPDYYESNTTTLKEYFTDINIKEKLKTNLPKDLSERTNHDNIFFLKVLLKNDMSLDNYKTVLREEFARLDSYLQQQFAKAISNLSRPVSSKSDEINPFKEIILLVNKNGELSYEYYKSNTIKTSKYINVLNQELNNYLNNNKNKNINIGKQSKKVNNKLFVNPFFSSNFKQINNENNILKIIRKNINDKLRENKELQIKTNFLDVYFVFFTLNEIYKEFFDKKYLKNQLTLEDEKKEVFLKVIFRYNILNDDDDYDIKKIVFNTSYKCQLEIDELPNYKISGHFKSKGKFYNFRVTYIDPIDLTIENRDLLIVLFEKIKNFSNKTSLTNHFFKTDKYSNLFDLSPETENILGLDLKTFFTNIVKIDYQDLINHIKKIQGTEEFDEADEKYYKGFTEYFNTTTLKKIDIETYKNQLQTIKKILARIIKLPNYKEIMFFILKGNEIKLRINKANNIFNFSVLDQVSEGSSSTFQNKFYGILKKYKTTHYYEPLSLNRINNTLSQNRKIYFYEDLYITKEILIKYLKSTNDYDEKTKPRKQIPYKLLKILSNNVLLNELFLYIYDNNKSYVYIEEGTKEEREKPNSNFNIFKMKAIKGLINIIFTKGTPFYVSRIQKDNNNSSSKVNYAAYTIHRINNLHYITDNTKHGEIDSFINKDFFYSSLEDSKQLLRQFDNEFSNNEETNNSSILYKKDKKSINRYISYDDYKNEAKSIIDRNSEDKIKDSKESKTLVILDFDLIPSNLVGQKQTCKTRKKRIGNKLWSLFNKQLQKANLFTRKLKNKLKTTRKKLLTS